MKTLALAALVLAASRPSSAASLASEVPGGSAGISFAASSAVQAPGMATPILFASGISAPTALLSAPVFAAASAPSPFAAAAPMTESDVKNRFLQVAGVQGVEIAPERQTVRVIFTSGMPLEWARKSGSLPRTLRLYGFDYEVVGALASEAGRNERQDPQGDVSARFASSPVLAQAKSWVEPADDGSLEDLGARTTAQARWRQEVAARFGGISGVAKSEAVLDTREATVTVEFRSLEELDAARKSGLLPGSVKSPSGLDYSVVPTLSAAP